MYNPLCPEACISYAVTLCFILLQSSYCSRYLRFTGLWWAVFTLSTVWFNTCLCVTQFLKMFWLPPRDLKELFLLYLLSHKQEFLHNSFEHLFSSALLDFLYAGNLSYRPVHMFYCLNNWRVLNVCNLHGDIAFVICNISQHMCDICVCLCERLKVHFVFISLQCCLVTCMIVAAHKSIPRQNLLHNAIQRTLMSRCLSQLSHS